MKIIKAKINGSDTLYVIKRSGLFGRKSAIYWISQNMLLPVVNVGPVQEDYKPEEAQEKADEKRDEMREDGRQTT